PTDSPWESPSVKKYHPLIALFLSAGFLLQVQTVCILTEMRSPTDIVFWTTWGMQLAVVFWIVCDAQVRRQTPCFDFGLFIYLASPLSWIWYSFWSRGWWGFLLVPSLFGLLVVPSIAAGFAVVIAQSLR